MSWSRLFGNQLISAYPETAATPQSRTIALAVPARVDRHPRVRPIASTIVNASTNSTAEARSVAAASPAMLQVIPFPPW